MKTLPLFYYPSTYLWVDDDEKTLKAMLEIFGAENSIKTFSSAQECPDFLNTYKSPLSGLSFIQSNYSDENYGLLQNAPMDFDVTQIAKLLENKNRHKEISVMIVDYDMPKINGLTLAEKTKNFSIQKILLTGNAEEKKVIDGFNHNLIQRFVQKSSPSMYEDLSAYLKELSVQYFEYLTKPLLTYLEADKKMPLSDPVFIDFFEEHCRKNHIKEYYLIDKQGSFLCINAHGEHSFVIIHSNQSIEKWLSTYGNDPSLSQEVKTAIEKRQKIPFFGLGKEAWQITSSEWEKHIYIATTLEASEKYFLAIM